MAKLNFPDPNDTQVYEAAGIKWTWNATMEVWSAEGPEGQYVAKKHPTTGNSMVGRTKPGLLLRVQ